MTRIIGVVLNTLFLCAIAPLVVRLPPEFSYATAAVYADLRWNLENGRRRMVIRCMRHLLELRQGDNEWEALARESFRSDAYAKIDAMLLRGNGVSFARLVKVRGLQSLKNAKDVGRGAIVCSVHFNSRSCIGLLGVLGFPVAGVARWSIEGEQFRGRGEEQPLTQALWRSLADKVESPNIRVKYNDPNLGVPYQIMSLLRRNGIAFMLLDNSSDRPGALQVKLLNGTALVLPGAVVIARRAGSPIILALLRRTRNPCRLVLDISGPISLGGDVATDYERCLSPLEMAIRASPSQWEKWSLKHLSRLGLL